MPFEMLESEYLGCWSIQIFQLFPNFLHQDTAWVWELCAAAAPQRDVGMGRGTEQLGLCPWHGSGGQAGAGCSGRGQSQKDPQPLPKQSPTPCRRCVWVRFWPKAICTCLPSSSCVSAETAGDSYGPQQYCFIPVFFWPLQPFIRDVLPPVPFSNYSDIHSVLRQGFLCSLPLSNLKENWRGMVWQPTALCGAA